MDSYNIGPIGDKDIAIDIGVAGSIPGPVLLNAMSPTALNYKSFSFVLPCLKW